MPETANEDRRGMRDTISLNDLPFISDRSRIQCDDALSLAATNHLDFVHDNSVPLAHDERTPRSLDVDVGGNGPAGSVRRRTRDTQILLQDIVRRNANVEGIDVVAPIEQLGLRFRFGNVLDNFFVDVYCDCLPLAFACGCARLL